MRISLSELSIKYHLIKILALRELIKISRDIYTLKLDEITPESIYSDKNIQAILASLNPEVLTLSKETASALIYSRIDELPENVIDLLAHQFHVDFYDLVGTLEMKRESVKGSIIWHMHKGTEWAILKALEMIGIEGKFLHWKDTGDEPYSFRIKAKITGDFYRTKGKDKIIASIRRAVMESKAARSWFKGLETSIEFKDESMIYAGLFNALTGFQMIRLAKIEPPGETGIYAGIASALQGNARILLTHETDIETKIYTGHVNILTGSHEIILEEEVMHDLLLRFEERIFNRIDALETKVMKKIQDREAQINANLEEIKEMLRWKGPDDPI